MKKDRVMLTPSFLDKPVPGLEAIAEPDWMMNKPNLPDGDTQTRMSAIHQPIADFMAATIAAGDRPVSLAGDCCAAIGALAGLQRAGVNPVFVWFDAHGDFNTWKTTPSGFLGGMPLAMMVGLGEQRMMAAVGCQPLPTNRVVLTDGRDLDPGEAKLVEESGIRHLPNVADLLTMELPDGPLYVHFDVDVLNLADVPAVSYPAAGGPTAVELAPVFRHLAQTREITAVSTSFWNPELDVDGRSQKTCLSLLNDLLGD